MRDCFEGCPRQQMNGSCRELLADPVVKRAPDALSDRHASAREKVDAFMCLLGVARAKQIVRDAPPHKMSQMIRRGLANPSARPYQKQLGYGLHAGWFSADGAPSAGNSQRRAFLETAGLTREA